MTSLDKPLCRQVPFLICNLESLHEIHGMISLIRRLLWVGNLKHDVAGDVTTVMSLTQNIH